MRRASRRRFARILAASVLTLAFGMPAFAVLPSEKLADPAQETRAAVLSKRLRCVVCQNQNIDDSSAPLAGDMRVLLRERIAKGDSDDQAVAYLVERYGNFVLLDPPFQRNTWFLWLAPFGILAFAGAAYVRQIRKSAALVPRLAPRDEEGERLAELY